VNERDISGIDALLRPIYDLIAPIHDAGVQYMLPLVQFPDPRATRFNYIDKLEIDRLGDDAEKPRFLEVGIGAAANVRLLDQALPMSRDVEIWGVDLSTGMIEQARRRTGARLDRIVRLALADAHALPFPDGCFDRVFSVGSINGYRDPRLALAEMARVAKPETPIVVVDEELDPKREHLLLHRLLFRALTVYDANPHAPLEAVPDGAIDVEVIPVSRFYYCMRFRMPTPAAGRAAKSEAADSYA
jgi:ubiquinone/menaquinone biosynthesis C-methylase UbiE